MLQQPVGHRSLRRSIKRRLTGIFRCVGFALIYVHLLAQTCGGSADHARISRSLTEYRPGAKDSADQLLVVTLLGGHVVAVRPDSGEVLWEYDTGTPLVRVNQGKAMPPGLHMFPGVDGGLYLYTNVLAATTQDGPAAPPPGPTLERLPITLPELVDTSPSLTDDGSIITGERRTTVFALDRQTGSLLHVFSEGAAGGPLAEAPDPLLRSAGAQSPPFGMEDVPVLQMLDPDRILLVGRQDYVVRSKQVLTDVEAWNATYSRLINLRSPGLGLATRVPGAPEGGAGAPLPLFAVGADHSLQAYDPASRIRRWSVRFKTPPVSVFASEHGDTNFLDPTAVRPLRDPDPAARATGRGPQQRGRAAGGGGVETHPLLPADGDSSSGGGVGRGNLVLVGELRGSLYAMPAEHVVLDERVEPQPWTAAALPGPSSAAPGAPGPSSGPLPLLPASATTPAASAASGGDAAANALVVLSGGGGGGGGAIVGGPTPGKDLVTYAREVESGEGVVSGLACRPPGLQLLATVGEPTGVRQSWLPEAPKSTAAAAGGSGGAQRQAGQLPLPSGGSGGGAAAVVWALKFSNSSVGVNLVVVLGGVVVLVVLRSGRGGGAEAQGARGGKGSSMMPAAAGGPVDVTAAAGDAAAKGADAPVTPAKSSGGGGGGRAEGRGSGPAQQRRRKGRAGDAVGGGNGRIGGGGGSPAAAGAGPSQVALPSIEEDKQLSPTEAAAAARTLSALLSPPSSSSPSAPSSSSTSVTHVQLPSAEPRVRLRADGSLLIGRLVVGPTILGYGSAGTVVYEGVLDGRPVAVKRLLRQFTELARKEIEVLILSDEHPNVVRCFALEEDREFVYLALERCRSTLSDFLDTPAGRNEFVDSDSRQPTPRCLATMQDIVRGLAALHSRGIVHRDLKPHNVLLTESGQRAKLSDMGLSKQLVPEQSSFESHHGPGGSSGWQAPEQLIARDGGAARQTRSMDVFSLGSILYYCLTGGRHPFGDNHYERDARILHGDPALAALFSAPGPEAVNLVAACLSKDPGRRPSVGAVLGHPLWWSDERRLGFLVDISDRVENEDREPDTSLLDAMESYAAVALAGPGMLSMDGFGPTGTLVTGSTSSASTSTSAVPGPAPAAGLSAALVAALSAGSGSCTPNWGAALPSDLVANLGRYRRYDYTSLRDLLRVVRNKRNHFREMPPNLQAMMGPLPGGFLRFFTARFPRLLLAVYVFALRHLPDEPTLQQYWADGAGGAEAAEPFVRTFVAVYGPSLKPTKAAAPPPPPPPPPQQQQQQPLLRGSIATASSEALGAGVAAGAGRTSAEATGGPVAVPVAGAAPAVPPPAVAAGVASVAAAERSAATESQPAAGVPRGHTGSIDGDAPAAAIPAGAANPAPPPPPLLPEQNVAAATSATYGAPPPLVLVGYEPTGDDGEVAIREFPRRPGKQQCDFYMKTGHCKFGESCVFDHPEAYAVRLTVLGLPLRPEEQICSFYLKNNDCRFGPACKFHHPMLRPVYAGSAAAEGVGGVGLG